MVVLTVLLIKAFVPALRSLKPSILLVIAPTAASVPLPTSNETISALPPLDVNCPADLAITFAPV